MLDFTVQKRNQANERSTLVAISLCLFTLFICLDFMNTSMFLLLARVKNDIFFLVHYVAPRYCFPLNQGALITMKEKIKQIMLLLWQVSSEVLCLTCSGLNQTSDSQSGKGFPFVGWAENTGSPAVQDTGYFDLLFG